MRCGGVKLAVLSLLLLSLSAGFADTVLFKTGEVITGTVLQTNQSSVFLRREYGTFSYPLETVKRLFIDEDAFHDAATCTNRIAGWGTLVGRLAERAWAPGMKQIPATVIDTGIFKNVPYSSFRAGSSYELNIFGDPQNPAAVQIGVAGGLLDDRVARDNCIEFIGSALTDPLDREVARKLSRAEDVAGHEGLVFQVTPPSAVDAYGGWWVSVYDEDKLNAARATQLELKDILEPPLTSTNLLSFNPNDSKWSIEERKQTLAPAMLRLPATKRPLTSVTNSHKTTNALVISTNSAGTNTATTVSNTVASTAPVEAPPGSIYVRGYYRKDGTYVRPHYRKK